MAPVEVLLSAMAPALSAMAPPLAPAPALTSADAGAAGTSPAAATSALPAMVQHITEALLGDRFTDGLPRLVDTPRGVGDLSDVVRRPGLRIDP
ncbi:MAG TPA: hypothetical protein PLK19_14705 [Mycobacterium sp.]|nr:hypothetical protein [Mycobacterium sp.]